MVKKIENLTGKRFGRLVVQNETERIKGKTFLLCLCDCGKTKKINVYSLKSGCTRSCGCLGAERRRLKGRWKTRSAICIICGKNFESKAASDTYCCSKGCKTKYIGQYYKKKMYSSVEEKLKKLLYSVKHRAKKQKLEYDLDHQFILNKYNQQEGKCIKTKIPFVLNNCLRSEGKGPWSASIDRIDPNKGYLKDNIQIVCLMYNLGKCMWTDKEVLEFCKKVVENQKLPDGIK